LSIGLVGIARSLLSSVSALEHSSNLMKKMSFLDNTMCQLEEKIKEKEGFNVEDQDIKDFLQQKTDEANESGVGRLDWDAAISGVSKGIIEFRFMLNWKEGNNDKSATLASYLSSQVKK